MNVSVGQEFEDYVKRKIATGEYASASEVIREGLRLMKEKDLLLEARLQSLRGEIRKGLDEAEAGNVVDGPSAVERIKQNLMRSR